ncbi:MAG: endo-1,4-beta-xylanase [Algisphaera sp.]
MKLVLMGVLGISTVSVVSPAVGALVDFNNFNGHGFDYTWEGFGETQSPTHVRLADPVDGWGGAVLDFASPLDMSNLLNHHLQVDYRIEGNHGADHFTFEFYDTANRSVKYQVATPQGQVGNNRTHTAPNAFGSPTGGIGDFSQFDFGHVKSFGVIGQHNGTQPFDVSLDDVRFTSEAPPAYGGRSADASWRGQAQSRIDQIRKAGLQINFTRPDGTPVSQADVHVIQQEHDFKFGSAVTARNLTNNAPDDVIYRQKVTELFNTVTLENSLKWEPWEGEWGDNFSQDRSLQALDWLAQQNINARGHVMVWPSWENLPESIQALENNPAALAQAVLDHIQEIGVATEGKVMDWDVVNEPRNNRDLMNLLGDTVIDDWFAAAKAHNSARLSLNEYNLLTGNEATQSARTTFLQEVQGLQQRGAPIEALGLQSHFQASTLTDIERVWSILDDFATATNLPVAITEFEFDTADPQLQADYLRDFMTAVFAHDSVDEFIMWGFWEGSQWKPDAALFDTDWNIKLAGEAFVDLVYNQWWTDENLATDESGEAQLRVFKGDYTVEVQVDGQTFMFDIQVGDDGHTLTQTLAIAITGDYNGDGRVSQADLDLVLLNWGAADVPADWLARSQFDGEAVSQNELDGVLLHWGDQTQPNLALLPEPSSFALMGLVGLGLMAGRR